MSALSVKLEELGLRATRWRVRKRRDQSQVKTCSLELAAGRQSVPTRRVPAVGREGARRKDVVMFKIMCFAVAE